MTTTDFTRTPATEAQPWIKKYLDPTEEVVIYARFHIASMLEPLTSLALGLVATAYADLAIRSGADNAREILVVVWVVWAAWALSTVWDYKTLVGFYKGSAVTRLAAFVTTLAALALLGYVGKTQGVGAALWVTFGVYGLWALLQFLRHSRRYMVITNKRLIVLEGLANRQIKSLPLGKLSDMIYQRTAMGQALGYGTFDLQAPGASVNLGRLTYVRNPDQTYLQVSHLLWASSAPPGPPKPKKILLDGQLNEPGGPGRNITLSGEMDG